jgi:hypothetical protein
MDRTTFRRIILKTAFKKRKMYETLLETVPMLRTLTVSRLVTVLLSPLIEPLISLFSTHLVSIVLDAPPPFALAARVLIIEKNRH